MLPPLTADDKLKIGLRLLEEYARENSAFTDLICKIFSDKTIQAQIAVKKAQSVGATKLKWCVIEYNYKSCLHDHHALGSQEVANLHFIRAVLLACTFVPRWGVQRVGLHSSLTKDALQVKYFKIGMNNLHVNHTMSQILENGTLSLYSQSFDNESCSVYLSDLGIDKNWHMISREDIQRRFETTRVMHCEPQLRARSLAQLNNVKKLYQEQIYPPSKPLPPVVVEAPPQPKLVIVQEVTHESLIKKLEKTADRLIIGVANTSRLFNRFQETLAKLLSLKLDNQESAQVQEIWCRVVSHLVDSPKEVDWDKAVQLLRKPSSMWLTQNRIELLGKLLDKYNKHQSDEDHFEKMEGLIRQILQSNEQMTEREFQIMSKSMKLMTSKMCPNEIERWHHLFIEFEDVLSATPEGRQFCKQALSFIYGCKMSSEVVSKMIDWALNSQISKEKAFWDLEMVESLVHMLTAWNSNSADVKPVVRVFEAINTKGHLENLDQNARKKMVAYAIGTEKSEIQAAVTSWMPQQQDVNERVRLLVSSGSQNSVVEAVRLAITECATLTPETALFLAETSQKLPYQNLDGAARKTVNDFFSAIEKTIFFSNDAAKKIDENFYRELMKVYDRRVRRHIAAGTEAEMVFAVGILQSIYPLLLVRGVIEHADVFKGQFSTIADECYEKGYFAQMIGLRSTFESLSEGLSDQVGYDAALRTILKKHVDDLVLFDDWNADALKDAVGCTTGLLSLYTVLDPKLGRKCVKHLIEKSLELSSLNWMNTDQLFSEAQKGGLFVGDRKSECEITKALVAVKNPNLETFPELLKRIKSLEGLLDLKSKEDAKQYAFILTNFGRKLFRFLAVVHEAGLIKLFSDDFMKQTLMRIFNEHDKKPIVSYMNLMLDTCIMDAAFPRLIVKALKDQHKEVKSKVPFVQFATKILKGPDVAVYNILNRYAYYRIADLIDLTNEQRAANIKYVRSMFVLCPVALEGNSQAFPCMVDLTLDVLRTIMAHDKTQKVKDKVTKLIRVFSALITPEEQYFKAKFDELSKA